MARRVCCACHTDPGDAEHASDPTLISLTHSDFDTGFDSDLARTESHKDEQWLGCGGLMRTLHRSRDLQVDEILFLHLSLPLGQVKVDQQSLVL